jgi:molybdate transport system substrate-binding protein
MLTNIKRTVSRARVSLLVACLLSVGIRPASAAEIKVLTANLFQPGLVELAERFKQATGHDVKIEVPRGPELARILASDEPADILLGTTASVDRAAADGTVAGSKLPVGRTGIAVMVRRGVPHPKVATAADIKQAVLAADAVAYNTAPSGQQLQKLFDQMGVADQIKDKSTRPPNGAQTMQHMVDGKGNEIGFGLSNEMTPYLDKGLDFVAMLPDDLQSYTTYDAAVLTRSKSSEAANAFLRYITTPDAKKVFAKSGIN